MTDLESLRDQSRTLACKGRRIERMIAACSSAGLPEPNIRAETTGLWTVFHFSAEYIATATQETTQETTQKTTQETTQEKILALLKTRPTITRRELAARLDMTTDGIKYHVQKMRAAKMIEHIGPTKSGHWEILK